MRIVIQRVSRASVTIGGNVKSAIGKGFLILLGVEESDTEDDVEWLVKKVIGLRVFDDENGVMNLNISQVGGDMLVVSRRGFVLPNTRFRCLSTRFSAAV